MGATLLSLGAWNTAVGTKALFANTTGTANTAFGHRALLSNNTGFFNTATGYQALVLNLSGSRNTSNGYQALYSNTNGDQNTATGLQALYSNRSGGQNTATGLDALYSNTNGGKNTAVGYKALYSNTIGFHNTAVGVDADVAVGNLINATVLGYSGSVNANNKVRIGNTAVTVIEGQVAYSFPSDARFKFNIHDEGVPGLAFINKLRPVTYQFDNHKFDQHLMQYMPDSTQRRRIEMQDYTASTAKIQTGFLAQEVEQVCKDLNFTFSGLHIPESDVDNYSLAYGSFVPLLVKAVQEQQAEIEQLKRENTALKLQTDKIGTMEAELRQIKAMLHDKPK